MTGRLRPAAAAPFSSAGVSTSRRYPGVLKACAANPSATSPAARVMTGLTPDT